MKFAKPVEQIETREDLVKRLRELQAAAERGEITGFMYLLEELDGTKRFVAVGDYDLESPEAMAEMRSVLEAMANGEDPAGGALLH